MGLATGLKQGSVRPARALPAARPHAAPPGLRAALPPKRRSAKRRAEMTARCDPYLLLGVFSQRGLDRGLRPSGPGYHHLPGSRPPRFRRPGSASKKRLASLSREDSGTSETLVPVSGPRT